jgi:hypothetical protein
MIIFFLTLLFIASELKDWPRFWGLWPLMPTCCNFIVKLHLIWIAIFLYHVGLVLRDCVLILLKGGWAVPWPMVFALGALPNLCLLQLNTT